MPKTITRRQAEALWSQLQDAFADVESAITEIIRTKAWEPLGYRTFAEAWADRLSHVRLATEGLRAHVVYGLLAEGLSDAEVVATVGGRIGDSAVAALREQRERGIPAGAAYTRVRSHDRARPSEAKYLHVQLTNSEIQTFKDIAKHRGLDVEQESAKAIRAHFRRLERARG